MKLAIVIAASNSPAALERCLDSLWEQAQNLDGEGSIIAVANFAPKAAADVAQTMAQRFAGAQFLSLPEMTTVPELRLYGIRQAQGEIVALLEDNVTVDKAWCTRIVESHHLPHPAIGGAVENVGGSALDWAVYFYEYGKYMLPHQAGPVDALPGNNASYKKRILEEIEDTPRDGFFEVFVHQELIRRGYQLYLAPEAIVYHDKRYDLRHTLAQCYHHGRAFAGMRVADASPLKRLLWVGKSLLLPIVLPARIVQRVLSKNRHRAQLGRALPYLLLFMAVWSYGEFCGYARGVGSSAAQWR